MGSKIRYEDLRNMREYTLDSTREWRDSLEKIRKRINILNNFEGFSGKAAASIKNYFRKVHLPIIDAIETVLDEYDYQLQEYYYDYQNDIDKGFRAVIDDECLATMLEQTKNRYNSFIGLHEEIHELVWGVNDIYSERIPSCENIENDYNAMANVVNNLMKNYADIEKTKTEIEFESLEESIDSVQASINSQKGKESSAKVSYTSGSILQDNCFNDMLTSIDARKQFLKDNENRIVEFGAFKDEETCALATNDKEYTREKQELIDYFSKSGNQILLGNYTDDVTLLGTTVQIATGIVGIDIVMDIRDLSSDVVNLVSNGLSEEKKSDKSDYMSAGIDLIAIIPVVGVLKYSDEVSSLAKHSDEAADILKAGDEAAGLLGKTDEVGELVENAGDGLKVGSSSTYSGEEWYNYYVNKYEKENVQGTFFNEINYEPTSGVKLTTQEGKTTTILGRYDMDTKSIFSETGNIKSISYDGHDGGFNLLNVPDELSYAVGVDFWNDYNVPFLDEVIGRKDIIQLATEPNQASMFRINTNSGLIERSGFGREILYLEEHGYKLDKTLMQMVPVD